MLSMLVDGVKFKKGQTVYNTVSAHLFHYKPEGISEVRIEKFEYSKGKAYGVENTPYGGSKKVELGSVECWRKRDNCLKYLDLCRKQQDGKITWEDFCSQAEKLHEKDKED